MSPIRVGFVGLTKEAGPGGISGWGVLAHFPYLLLSPDYEITALCNSSVASAKAVITHHKLGEHIKAYGSPEDLAKDPDIDLVVVSTNVSKHYEIAKPILKAGKDILVEWPLAVTTSEAEELVELAKTHGVKKAVVALQTRADPLTIKLKEMVDGGKIGRVVSSTVQGSMRGLTGNFWPSSAKFFLDGESGGNFLSIAFGHFLGSFRHVLGPFAELKSILSIQYPTVNLIDATGNVVTQNFQKTASDHILIQGVLASGAVTSINFHQTGDLSIYDKGLLWTISGTQGDIEVTIPKAVAWQMGPPSVTLKVTKGTATDVIIEDIKLETVGVDPGSQVQDPATNTARLYGKIALGERAHYATFEDGLVIHRLIDDIRLAAKQS